MEKIDIDRETNIKRREKKLDKRIIYTKNNLKNSERKYILHCNFTHHHRLIVLKKLYLYIGGI